MTATTPDGVTNPPKVGTGSDYMRAPILLEQKQRLMRDRYARAANLPDSNASGKLIPFERHYRAKELAEIWGLDESTIRRLFQDEPGVLKIGRSGRHDGRRDYVSIRIPESVAARVHTERSR